MAKRTLHPALAQRAQAVKRAHHSLKSNPDFQRLGSTDRLRVIQATVNRTKKG